MYVCTSSAHGAEQCMRAHPVAIMCPSDNKFLLWSIYCPCQNATDILEENVVQPLLVSTSAIKLAAETVRSIMKVDDIVSFAGTCDHTLFGVFVQINARYNCSNSAFGNIIILSLYICFITLRKETERVYTQNIFR